MLPLDKAFFLVQQTRSSDSCVVLWVPISSLNEWGPAEKTSFEFFSDRVPWLSVRRPWSLNLSVVKFITQEWSFWEDPILVVVDEQGLVANTNAMDMVWIWGPKAFPFSSSRERELWEQADWTVDLMINGISPLLSEWVKICLNFSLFKQCIDSYLVSLFYVIFKVEQGRNLCIYGSDNMDWIRKLNDKIKKIRSSGIHLEAAYVGCKNPGENVRGIIHTIDQEGLSSSMTFNGVDFFWFRLETLKRSVGQQDRTSRCDEIAARVRELLEMESRDGWAVIGRGSSRDAVRLDLEVLEQGLESLHSWRENVTEMGLGGALTAALEARVDGERCRDDEVVAYEEGLIEKTKICGSCKNPMEKFVCFKCDA